MTGPPKALSNEPKLGGSTIRKNQQRRYGAKDCDHRINEGRGIVGGVDEPQCQRAECGADRDREVVERLPSGVIATGVSTRVAFTREDVDADGAVLLARGVDADKEVMGNPVPPMFFSRDQDENRLLIVERN